MTDRQESTESREESAEDPGAYIGHEPERATETTPGGIDRHDEPVADEPSGHREGPAATDDAVREAGENR